MMRVFIFLLAVATVTFARAQDRKAEDLINRIEIDGAIPKDFRSGKSLLLISCSEQTDCTDWREMAAEAQPFLADAGIDAIATYFLEDILSGVEPSRTFLQAFDDREITHLVFLRHDTGGYQVILTEFNPREFVLEGQAGWDTKAPELRDAMTNTYRAVSTSGQKLRNLLILNQPEFGDMVNIFTGRRAEFYDLNFESDKLAIYPFADTAQIREVMADYPYKYEIIDPEIPEKELRSEGYDFVLYYVHTRAENAKKLLGYEVNDKETSFVSESMEDGKPVLNTYSKDSEVYKFYIKHVYSGNIFLGKKWDAAPDWPTALSNYISLLRNELLNN